jgi:TadE-like protein
MMRRHFKRLAADTKGISVVEFAMIAPTLMLMLMGLFDLSYRAFIVSVMQGEMQKSGRDSSLEDGGTGSTALDARVRNRIKPLVSNAEFAFERKNYESFTRAGQQEPFVDQKDAVTNNFNGVRDPGECFTDENANGIWDAVGGQSGQGTSDDIVQYKVTVTYPRIFPMYGLLGWAPTQTATAVTVLRNQPYGTQQARVSSTICT